MSDLFHDLAGNASRNVHQTFGAVPSWSRFKKWKRDWRRRRHHQNVDLYIVSYPKSGRTWLRVLIGKALCEQYGLDEQQMLETLELSRAAGAHRTEFTHDGAETQEVRRWDEFSASKREYCDKKILMLVRDPRDLLVSSYFQATRRSGAFDGELSDFLRSEEHGFKKIVTFLNLWYANQHIPASWLVLRYEEMQRDPHSALRTTLEYMGLCDVDDAVIDEAVQFGDFQNLQKLEATGYFESRCLTGSQQGDPESLKVRRGKIGGYRDYLSEEDLAYIQSVLAETPCHFFPDLTAKTAA